ncbi:glycosyltransferase family 2 protein [Lachnospiraceae bacterium SGI.256]
MKKVSVIVPVYNTEKFLRKCIDSLLNQTLEEIEIVIVDDGSTDHSKQILEEYAQRYQDKIKLYTKANGGQASARNLALKHCSGKYIGFLDSDDYVKEEMFEKLYRKAEKEKLDYVGCGYTDFTYQDGKKIILKEYVGQKVCNSPKEMYRDSLVSPFINFYKKSVIEEAGAVFPEGMIYEDTAFFVNLIPYIKSVGYIEEALACRLRRSNSTTTLTSPAKIAQIFLVIQRIMEFYAQKGIKDEYKNEIEYFCVRILLCSSMERISRISRFTDRKKLIDETWKMIKQEFPYWKKNQYFQHTKKDLYMKHANKIVMLMVCEILHIKGKSKKQYV